MKLQHTALVLTVVGAFLFAFSLVHSNGHSYDMHGFYVDPATGITYAEQSTEMIMIGGFFMLATGLLMFLRVRVKMAR